MAKPKVTVNLEEKVLEDNYFRVDLVGSMKVLIRT